jgi:hypothetical protein
MVPMKAAELLTGPVGWLMVNETGEGGNLGICVS